MSGTLTAASKVNGVADSFQSGWRARATLTVLFLVSALCQIDRILPFILAESIKRDLSLSDTELGLLTGIAFAVCHSLMSLPFARLADHGPLRWILTACIFAWSVMTGLGGLAGSFWSLGITRFGVALGEAGAVPGSHALIARKIEPANRGQAISLFSLGLPLGTMAGFALGGRISDNFGWRSALLGAGAIGSLLALLVPLVAGATPPLKSAAADSEPFLRTSFRLLLSPVFRWLFIGAIAVGFASTPFYTFATPFLIRTHGYTASEAGLAFGLLQGLMGIVGMLFAGRGFDHAHRSGRKNLLFQPAVLFLIASATTFAGLFAPVGWMSIALFIPAMLSFTFLLPWAFGTAHLVAGPGKQALASSLVMIGSSLVGPALGPLLVGMISDAVAAAEIAGSLKWGMLVVPMASVITGWVLLIANSRLIHLGSFGSMPATVKSVN
jgi:predicted MFS family arabinose efflux permease